jgi:hypothetical protein
MEQRIAKIEAHTEKLLNLLLGAHTVLAILRPMNTDEILIARLSRENRGAGFGTIRHVLYWSLVQELVKIVADADCRVPSIHNLRKHLTDPQVKARLEDKYSVWASSAKESDSPHTKEFWKQRNGRSELERRESFNSTYKRTMQESAELLNSSALAGMKEVRDKLLAHNELKLQSGSYRFIDIRSYGLKYGDEKVLLEKATQVFDSFFTLVKHSSFDWDHSKAMMEHDAGLFWRE